ncbi:MAG: hypothetical protein N2556_00820 [Anaerolineae bacterium]|nr:hypothetical protein [Anaerolineae bacterium]
MDFGMLNQSTARFVRSFFLNPDQFQQELGQADTWELAQALLELLRLYANDKNSSTLREWIVLQVAGCQQQPGKIGYNGYLGSVPYEVKPRNVRSGENKKLNGGGNFTDFTYERLEKYNQDQVHILVAGFVDGTLVYILEVPFAALYETIKWQLDRHFQGNRPAGLFLRSASFTFRDYQEDRRVRLLFLNSEWQQFHPQLTRNFTKYLEHLGKEAQCRS